MIIHRIKYCSWGLYFVARMDVATMPKTQSINQKDTKIKNKRKQTVTKLLPTLVDNKFYFYNERNLHNPKRNKKYS